MNNISYMSCVSNHLPLQTCFFVKILVPWAQYLLSYFYLSLLKAKAIICIQWGFHDNKDGNSDDLKFEKSIWNSKKYFHFPKCFHFSESEKTSIKWTSILREELFPNLYDSTNSSQIQWTPSAGFYLFVLQVENYSLFLRIFTEDVLFGVSFILGKLTVFFSLWPHHAVCES